MWNAITGMFVVCAAAPLNLIEFVAKERLYIYLGS